MNMQYNANFLWGIRNHPIIQTSIIGHSVSGKVFDSLVEGISNPMYNQVRPLSLIGFGYGSLVGRHEKVEFVRLGNLVLDDINDIY